MLTVQQRLGMVLGLLGRLSEARELLEGVAPALCECSCCWLLGGVGCAIPVSGIAG